MNFGLAPYQPHEDINLTVDNFAAAGGLLRGLFSYLYSAAALVLALGGARVTRGTSIRAGGAREGEGGVRSTQ